ncbi:FMN-dependent alpha-hydroxy acid dehydrogenase [Cantharellus anzutake]|uniref:FMN-dependent alpha-hydroxy acid dehydrogenase n=1 Tax=Cantharellus anzutake TaxID=1750568 RepID=UPI001909035A|nr:FMN-dependent alpha-hydroxy acid dehydrogenase [Cantharellus anzutake]KAF8337556.1 FMN-dependent alpha-hydroxy acid dehydrogenase [Cantharellus anzutake]
MSDDNEGNAAQAAIIKAIRDDPSLYQHQIYLTQRPPIFQTVDMDKLEELAAEKLRKGNRERLNSFGKPYGFRQMEDYPRMMVDATVRDLSVTLFGKKYPHPIILGPVGVQGIAHEDAELATARAAQRLKAIYTLSTAASRSIEQVANENGAGSRWFQLYWPKDNAITLSLLNRAKQNGYSALVVTLDTILLGWRPEDLKINYLPFIHGVGCQIGFSDPVFMTKCNSIPMDVVPTFPYDPETLNTLAAGNGPKTEEFKKIMEIAIRWLKDEVTSGFFRTWSDVGFLRTSWEGPLLLKGIQSLEDAEKAIDAGVDGIVVSNHGMFFGFSEFPDSEELSGGRQVDGAIGSLDALERIMKSSRVREAQKTGKFTVLFDSGIRTGSDILKALGLGAQAVLVGRSYMYGLALQGQEGVEEVLKILLSDLNATMGLAGYKDIEDVRSNLLHHLVRA